MAQIIETKTGHKVIRASASEFSRAVNSSCICDNCGQPARNAYYVAAINRALCADCYFDWSSGAKYYVQVAAAEKQNFEFMKERLKI